MHRSLLSILFLLFLSSIGHTSAGAAEKSIAETRFDGFLQALAGASEARREFVQKNFTQAAIDRQGLDGTVEFLGRVHADLGPKPPQSVKIFPDRVEARYPSHDGESSMVFTLRLSAAPESKIEGFTIGPDGPGPGGPVPVASVAAPELPQAIAAAMEKHASEGFSGVVIVAKDGKPIFSHAYGEADRMTHRPNTLDTPFNLGSDNKVFTALVIARLFEQGKLGWNDKVGKYVPDWPQADVREKVTIENLLTHTSGIGDYFGPKHDAQLKTLRTVAQYAALFEDARPAAEPGKHFQYSNDGYVLLGLIAEKASGRDYYDLVRDLVYKPAGMNHSDHYDPSDEHSGRAIGYDRDGHANTDRLALRGSPAGGGYASANDLLRFANTLQAGQIVTPATLALMTANHADMGPNGGYGYGFGVFQDRERHYGHSGGSPGVNAAFEIFPDSGYVVIVLANIDRAADDTEQQIGRMIISRKPGS